MTTLAFRKVTGPMLQQTGGEGGWEKKNYLVERGWWPWREVDEYSRDTREAEMMGLGGR